MLLVVDVGNSNIVTGIMDEAMKIIFSCRIRTTRDKTKEEFIVELRTIMDVYKITMDNVDGAIISTVVPEITDAIKEAVQVLSGVTPMIVGRGIRTGIKICTDNPATLGTDLVVDAVAASEVYDGPLIIFDLGTATTCSVVEADKRYIGTLILPGVHISMNALSQKASQLPHIRYEKPKNMIGKNTVESMQAGALYGTASMIDGLIDRVNETLCRETTVVVTGGIGGLIVPYCKHEMHYDPELLLKGLWYIYHKNI